MTKLPATKAGMLEVPDVWTNSASAAFGYRTVALNAKDCAQPNNVDLLMPSCGRPFPWIPESLDHINAILAGDGVTQVVDGTIRGHDKVPAGTIIDPQEIREKVLYLNRDTRDSIVIKYARACAKPFSVAGVNGFRTKIRSLDTGSNIDAFLVVGGHGLIWLELDEPGWTEGKYPAILKKALRKAEV